MFEDPLRKPRFCGLSKNHVSESFKETTLQSPLHRPRFIVLKSKFWNILRKSQSPLNNLDASESFKETTFRKHVEDSIKEIRS